MGVKAKIFTFNAGWGFLASKPEKVEMALNDFIVKNGISEKEILQVTQSESEGKMLTLTIIYRE